VQVGNGGEHQFATVAELTQRPVAVEAQQPTKRPVSWSWSTCSAGASRQIAHSPPCRSTIAARSEEVSPYERRKWLSRFRVLVHGLQ
jgi:hypothetical protein